MLGVVFLVGQRRAEVEIFVEELFVLFAFRVYGGAESRQALRVVPTDRLAVNPDCGLVHLPRPVAFAKLEAMVAGAAIVRRELGAA